MLIKKKIFQTIVEKICYYIIEKLIYKRKGEKKDIWAKSIGNDMKVNSNTI